MQKLCMQKICLTVLMYVLYLMYMQVKVVVCMVGWCSYKKIFYPQKMDPTEKVWESVVVAGLTTMQISSSPVAFYFFWHSLFITFVHVLHSLLFYLYSPATFNLTLLELKGCLTKCAHSSVMKGVSLVSVLK